MALQPNKVPVQFRGLETKLDPKAAVIGDLVVLENIRFDKPPALQKRYGYELAAKIASGRLIASHKDQLLIGDGERLWSFSEAGGLRDAGPLPLCTVSSSPIVSCSDGEVQQTCSLISGGFRFEVWTVWSNYLQSTGAAGWQTFLAVSDVATGQVLRTTEVGVGRNAAHPGLALFGGRLAVFFIAQSATPSVCFSSYLLSGLTGAPGVSLGLTTGTVFTGTDSEATVAYDLTTVTTNGPAYAFLAVSQAGLNVHRVVPYTVSPSYVVSSGPPKTIAADLVAVASSPQGVWLAAVGASTLVWHLSFAMVEDAASSVTFTEGTQPRSVLLNTILINSQPAVRILRGYASSTTISEVQLGVGLLARPFQTHTFQIPLNAVTRPFQNKERTCVVVRAPSALQGALYLLQFDYTTGGGVYSSSTVTLAAFALGLAGSEAAGRMPLPAVQYPRAGVVEFSAPVVTGLDPTSVETAVCRGARRFEVDFTTDGFSLEAGGVTLFSGGLLRSFDGSWVSEHGFPQYPEGGACTAALYSGGGAGASAGAYKVCFTFEKTDANGVVHQSSPTKAVAVTESAGGSEQITAGHGFSFTLPALQAYGDTGQAGGNALFTPQAPRVVAWRTMADQSVFYRVPLNPANPWIDTTSDADLAKQQELIFNPLNSLAEVPPIAPGAVSHLTRYRNRVILVPSESRGQFFFSKVVLPGGPIEFNPLQFFQTVQGGAVPLNAALEMDEKLILFAEDHVFWTAGDGPAANGTSSDYSNPYRIPTEVGCSSPRSLTLFSEGIFFQALKGLYKLGRDLSVQYAGAPVEALLQGSKITSANTLQNSQRIVFTLSSGVALVFDSLVQKWSRWLNLSAVDAFSFRALFTWVSSDGSVYRETPGRYADGTVPVLRRIVTSVLSFAGLSAAQRVWRLILRGAWKSPHRLTVSVAFDEEKTPSQVDTFDSTTEPPLYEHEIKLRQERSTCVQVTIDEEATVAGEGFDLTGLLFLVGEEPKAHKMPRSRSGTRSSVSSVTVRPSSVVMLGEARFQFVGVVRGTLSPSQKVTWRASLGSIDSRGRFTAPPALPNDPLQIVITATSVADPTKSGTALVTVLSLSAKNFVTLEDGTKIIVDEGGYVLADDQAIAEPVPVPVPVLPPSNSSLPYTLPFTLG